MSEHDDGPDFEQVREQAAAAVGESDAASMYVGLVDPDADNEYYFANDVDESELQGMASLQLGMLARVVAAQSDVSVEEVADLAVDAAKRMDVR